MENDRIRPGYIVRTKDGKIGRTYHEYDQIDGKVQVYLCTKTREIDGQIIPETFDKTGLLCDPGKLKIIGKIT